MEKKVNQLSEFRINNFVRRFVEEPMSHGTYYTLLQDFKRFEEDEKEAIFLDILFYFKFNKNNKN